MLKQSKSLCAQDKRKYAVLDVPEPSEDRITHEAPRRHGHACENAPANICLDGTALFQSQFPKLPSLFSLIHKTTVS